MIFFSKTFIKSFLLLIPVLALFITFFWPSYRGHSSPLKKHSYDANTAAGLIFQKQTKSGGSIMIYSQSGKDMGGRIIEFRDIKMTMTDPKGQTMTVTAPRGVWDHKTNNLLLVGGVKGNSEKGMRFETNSAVIFYDNDVIEGHEPMTVHYDLESTTLNAQKGFWIRYAKDVKASFFGTPVIHMKRS